MKYVFDTNSFIVLSHFFPDRFPSFWDHLNEGFRDGRFVSVREVRRELSSNATQPSLEEWVSKNGSIFKTPTRKEMLFVQDIFRVPKFSEMIRRKQLLKGMPVADPFVVACAKINERQVITEEKMKQNSSHIPNVCAHFKIPCTNLQGFMRSENWTY